MRSKMTIIIGAVFICTIGVLVLFSGVFGEYSESKNELIGYVAEDGTLLDLDGNPIDEQPVDYSEPEPELVPEPEPEPSPDLTPVEEAYDADDEILARAIREEEELMANPPRFDISAGEVHDIIDSLNVTNQFGVIFDPGDAEGDDLVGSISLIIDSDDPLADTVLMYELEQIITAISERLGFVYPVEEMEKIMKSVIEGAFEVDVIQYEDVTYQFSTHHKIYMFSMYTFKR